MPIKNLFACGHGQMTFLNDVEKFDFGGKTGWQPQIDPAVDLWN